MSDLLITILVYAKFPLLATIVSIPFVIYLKRWSWSIYFRVLASLIFLGYIVFTIRDLFDGYGHGTIGAMIIAIIITWGDNQPDLFKRRLDDDGKKEKK